jgi:hypothetical protein
MSEISAQSIFENVNAYEAKYIETGDNEFLNRVISILSNGYKHPEFPKLNSEERSSLLGRLGMEYLERYVKVGDILDLDLAFKAFHSSIEQIDFSDPRSKNIAIDLPTHLRTDNPTKNNKLVVEKTIGLYEDVLNRVHKGSEDHQVILLNLAVAHKQLYELRGLHSDLDNSILIHDELQNLINVNSPIRSISINNYGNALYERYKILSSYDDLLKAITFQTEAISLSSALPNYEAAYRYSIHFSYYEKYLVTNNESDLYLAIENLKRSIDLMPIDSADKPERILSYAILLKMRFIKVKSITDLDNAVEVINQIIAVNSKKDENNWKFFSVLANLLHLRHDTTGGIYDLDQAIEAITQAIVLLEDDSSDLPYLLADRSILLAQKFDYDHNPSLLDLAEKGLIRAISLVKNDQVLKSRFQQNLANVQKIVFEISGDQTNLVNAIEIRKDAIKSTSHDSDELAGRIASLGQDFFSLFQVTQESSYLNDAIKQLRLASSLQHSSELEAAGTRYVLTNLLMERYNLRKSNRDLDEARTLYPKVIETATRSSINLLLSANVSWANWNSRFNFWDQAVQAFEYALSAADELVQIQRTLGHKAIQIEKLTDLHINACYAFAKYGKNEEAVMALERGRARILAQSFTLRNPELSRLASEYPLLATSLCKAASRLDEIYRDELLNSVEKRTGEEYGDAIAVFNDWRNVVSEIRKLDGYENFNSEITFKDILSVASSKPIIYIAPTYWEGLAFLITPDGLVRTIHLPELTTVSINKFIIDLTMRYAIQYDLLSSIDEICSWLWMKVMEPICTLCKSINISDVFLVPCGILGVLPLYASWTSDKSRPTGRLYALDLVNFSFIPSVRSVLLTREAMKIPIDSVLVIEDPTSTLQYAPLEAEAVLGFFTNKDLIGGEAATKFEVLTRLGQKNVLHFSCHGYSNVIDPIHSGLLMANDETLTVADIQQVRLIATRLVVLSACETGLIGRQLMDEVIGFPSAWLGLGVPGIISSIWTVDDESTSILMGLFYKYLIVHKYPPGDALRQAQIMLRDTPSGQYMHPYFWAAFYMTGC